MAGERLGKRAGSALWAESTPGALRFWGVWEAPPNLRIAPE